MEDVACANGVKCRIVEWVKRHTLRLFSHIERKKSEEFVKNIYVSEIDGLGGEECSSVARF